MTKSKVTKLEQWDNSEPDQYGNYRYNIEFEDKTKGIYTGNPTKGLKFELDKEYEYESTKKEWKSGKEYNKITPPQKEYKKSSSNPFHYDKPEVQNAMARDIALESAIDYILATNSNGTLNDVKNTCTIFEEWIKKDYSDATNNNLARRRALQKAVKSHKLASEVKILVIADNYYKYLKI